jgi:hypothetical protein
MGRSIGAGAGLARAALILEPWRSCGTVPSFKREKANADPIAVSTDWNF